MAKIEPIRRPIEYMKTTLKKKKKTYITFLRGVTHRKVRGLDSLAKALHKQAFQKIDCLECANCCKTMSPTYKKADVQRISKHLKMSYQEYFDKYLYFDETGDIMNKSVPCQFLKKDNKCSIYSVRPKDCSGFPHTQNNDFKLFVAGTHKQNIEYCPATLYVVERMHQILLDKGKKRTVSAQDAKL